MIDTTTMGEQVTSHSAMLANCREALDKLLVDQATQQTSVDALAEIVRRQNGTLEENQEKRTSMLAGLAVAQLAANKAQAAAELAQGTPVLQEREQAAEQARAAINAIHAEMLALAQADTKVRSEMEGTAAVLEDAQHNLVRIQERVGMAQGIFDEEEAAHREEIKQAYLAALTEARERRDHVKQQLVLAEDAITEAQQALATALKSWPEYATRTLDEVLEVKPYPGSLMLDTYMHLEELIEEHAQGLVRSDPMTLKVLSTAIPTYTFAQSGSRATQIAHARATLKSPGRGIRDDLWHYDSFLAEVEQLRALRQKEHRAAVIHEMIQK